MRKVNSTIVEIVIPLTRVVQRCAAILVLAIFPAAAVGDTTTRWNLPFALDERNVDLHFTVDTTWHTVEGAIRKIGGECRYESDPDGVSRVAADVAFAVDSFDTESRSRDKELKRSMELEHFPEAKLHLIAPATLCGPEEVTAIAPCIASFEGRLTIRDISKTIAVPGAIRVTGSGYEFSGSVSFRWLDFGISDPSILIAKVDKTVTVHYVVQLPPSSVR